MWGTSGAAAALVPQVSPLTVGAVTLGLGGVILALTSVRSLPVVFRAPGAWPLLLGGSLALATYILAFFVGMALTGVALGTVIAIASAPAFVGVIEFIVDRRRPSLRWTAATGLSVAGTWMLVRGRGSGIVSSDSDSLILGILAALLAGLCYAAFTWSTAPLIVPSTVRPCGLNERHAMSAVQGLTVVPLFVVAIASGLPPPSQVTEWSVLLYIAAVPTAVWLPAIRPRARAG